MTRTDAVASWRKKNSGNDGRDINALHCESDEKTELCTVVQVIRSKIRSNWRSLIVRRRFRSQMLYPVELRAPEGC
jgi:hypothetical protein